MKPRNWYRFENAASDPTVAEIHIIDIIGDWIDELINEYYGMKATVTAKAFVDQLAALPETVTAIRVHINSPGGDVFAAANIANALRDQSVSKNRTVTTIIDGLAASAASVIAMAGQTVEMADNALLMIHNPWSVAVGEAADMRKLADTLDVIRGTIVATYKWHSTLEDEAIVALMDAETWMTADQALEGGFVTSKLAGLKAAASIDRRALATLKVPDQYRARVDALLAPAPPTPTAPAAAAAEDITRACAEAGLDLPFAAALMADKPTLEQVTAKVAAEKATRAATAARSQEITALCETAKVPELAAGYIAGAMAVADVRTHLTTITAKLDRVEIDSSLKPQQATSGGERWKQAFARGKRSAFAH